VCRWLAYSGSQILLEELLYRPQNSLILSQSLHSQLGVEATNGDGFGIGWYGAEEAPAVYHSIEPAWNERNLRELSAHISSRSSSPTSEPRPEARFRRRTATRSATASGSGCTTA
jgi:predicted glutamine amidotransferase